MFSCHLCGSRSMREISLFGALKQVTSDCRPWPGNGRLGICADCGTVQKAADSIWKVKADEIYRGYGIYSQADGAEQVTFDQMTGAAVKRSRAILEKAGPHMRLRDSGRLLDIGCGNGAFLRSFGEFHPGWVLAGTERSQQYRLEVEAMPGVEALYGADVGPVPGEFDMISMIHVLEHIPGPAGLLRELRGKLNEGGYLLIQVPEFRANPFDLTIADHCSHFTPATLTGLLDTAGYQVLHCRSDWVSKELTVIATPGTDGPAEQKTKTDQAFAAAESSVAWLVAFAETARSAAGKGPVAIFGSSIAATWLFAELDGDVAFFVDEDVNRIGQSHLDRMIRSPSDVPQDVSLALALAPAVAAEVFERLEDSRLSFLIPQEETSDTLS